MNKNSEKFKEHLKRIGYKKGRVAWNKGKKCPTISEGIKKGYKKGRITWNKGLTIEMDNRISQPWLGKKRPEVSERMKGENNPAKRPEVRKKLNKKRKKSLSKRILSKELRFKLGSGTRGKTYEEIHGLEKAKLLKKNISKRLKNRVPIKHSEKTKEKLRKLAYKRKPKYTNTKPELCLQNKLLENNIKFETHKKIYGRPDIFIKPNICVFVDGEYWHNYPNLREIDIKVNKKLKKLGYVVLRFWDKSEIYKDINKVLRKIKTTSVTTLK